MRNCYLKSSTCAIAFIFGLLNYAAEIEASGSNATTIGQCTFYGDKQAQCKGRLRCKPSDFSAHEGYPLPDLEHVCPGVDEEATGNWSLGQGVVPGDYADVPYPAEVVANCYFRTAGTFYCTGGPFWQGTFWEGVYSGSLNSAFTLGLDKWFFQHFTTTTTPRPTTTTTMRTTTRLIHIIYQTVKPKPNARPSVEFDTEDVQERDDDSRRRGSARDNVNTGDRDDRDREDENTFPQRQREPTDNEEESSPTEVVPHEETQPVYGTNDEVNRFDAIRASEQEGDEQSSITYTVVPQRVYVCEYYNNGQVGCRNCTEKVVRITLDTGEIGNRRDYNCTQPRSGPILKRWNIDNGVIPMTPDPDAPTRLVVATCIFHKNSQTYECHGESALCPDSEGSRVHTNKCLGGRRWSGEFTGNFGYLT